MSNPTTPFSWQMPTATDLVTDLPADFAVFGQAVATSMADLLGGTTGQVLSKTTNADMDFTWINNDQGDITGVTAGTGISGGGTSGTVTVTNSMATAITTAGDVIQGTGSGTFARLGIGTAGQVLTVNGGATALQYSTPASGSLTLITSTDMAGAATVTFASITGTYKNLVVLIKNAYLGTDFKLKYELNADTTAGNYDGVLTSGRVAGALSTGFNSNQLQDLTQEGADSDSFMYLMFPDYTNTIARKQIQNSAGFLSDNGQVVCQVGTHQWRNTVAITEIKILNSLGTNFTAGTCQLYGVN